MTTVVIDDDNMNNISAYSVISYQISGWYSTLVLFIYSCIHFIILLFRVGNRGYNPVRIKLIPLLLLFCSALE